MLVALVLLLGEEGIGGVGDEAAAVVGAVLFVVLVLFSSETSASCDDCFRRRCSDARRAGAAPRGGHRLSWRRCCCCSRCSGTRHADALLVGDIGWVAMITAETGAAVHHAVRVLAVRVLLSSEAQAWWR